MAGNWLLKCFLFEILGLTEISASYKLLIMAALDTIAELNRVLEEWETENANAGLATSDPIPKLKR